MFQIKDNFLPKDEFLKIKNILLSKTFPWFYTNNVAHPEDNAVGNFYLSHTIYGDGNIMSQPALNLLGPILLKLKIKKLFRVKCNFYPHTSKIKNTRCMSIMKILNATALYFTLMKIMGTQDFQTIK